MANIERRERASGATYRVRWPYQGGVVQTSWVDHKDAKRCAKIVEGVQHEITREEAIRLTLGEPVPEEAQQPQGPTLDKWFERWRAAKTGVQVDTLERYQQQYMQRISPAIVESRRLGNYQLHEITAETIGIWVNLLANDPEKAVKPATIRRYHTLFHQILEAAVPIEISHNPARKTLLPKQTGHALEGDDEHVYLTHEEAKLLLSALEPGLPRDLVTVLLGTGMRWSEATALRKQDVILGADEADMHLGAIRDTEIPVAIHIKRAWKYSQSQGWYVGPPKSKRSKRRISLPHFCRRIIQERIKELNAAQLVFSWNGHVRLANAEFVRGQLHPAIERIDLNKKPTPHDFRHTHVAWLIAAKQPLPAIQRRIGHESITTTVDTYGHLLPDIDDELLTRLDAALEA